MSRQLDKLNAELAAMHPLRKVARFKGRFVLGTWTDFQLWIVDDWTGALCGGATIEEAAGHCDIPVYVTLSEVRFKYLQE